MKSLLTYLCILLTLIFLLIVAVLLLLAPEIDPLRSGISFYALTRYAPLIDLALALVGAAGILLAVVLWPAILSVAGRIGLALLFIWGITSILAGAFPLDAPEAAPTTSGNIHNLAGLNFLLIAPAVLLIERTPSSHAGRTQSSRITGWLAWLVLVLAILLFTFNGPLASLGIGGLIQRLYWLGVALWILSKAQHVLRAARPSSSA